MRPALPHCKLNLFPQGLQAVTCQEHRSAESARFPNFREFSVTDQEMVVPGARARSAARELRESPHHLELPLCTLNAAPARTHARTRARTTNTHSLLKQLSNSHCHLLAPPTKRNCESHSKQLLTASTMPHLMSFKASQIPTHSLRFPEDQKPHPSI